MAQVQQIIASDATGTGSNAPKTRLSLAKDTCVAEGTAADDAMMEPGKNG